MGRKPGAEQRLQGAQAAKGAWEELEFQHSSEENRITGGAQAWEGFPWRDQPGRMSWRRGIPHVRDCRECKDTAAQGSFFVSFLTLLPKHNTRDLAQCDLVQPKGTPNVTGMAGTRTGAPGVMSRLWSGVHLSWPWKHLSHLKVCSVSKIKDVNNFTIFMNKAIAT